MPPDFLVIGAQKAGTTWLYERLRTHPQIWLPYQKELHYFDEKRRHPGWSTFAHLRGRRSVDIRWRRQLRRLARRWRDPRSARELAWWGRYFFGRVDDRWYLRQFDPAGSRVSGDITPGYAMLDADAVGQVHSLAPDARIVFFLRHPVERCWSHAVMQLQLGLPGRIADDLTLQRHFEGAGSRARTAYLQIIETWASVYSSERVFIGFFEDIVLQPAALLDRVCEFLDVDRPAAAGDRVGTRVHSGRSSAIPARHAAFLSAQYAEAIDELAIRFGGLAEWWRTSAVALSRLGPDDADVPYPLATSPLFERWRSSLGHLGDDLPPLGSDTLAAIRARMAGAADTH